MECPVDGSVLLMSERHGVEIDYCPTCRGIWLDRGELDKILEQSSEPGDKSQDTGERHDGNGATGSKRRKLTSFFEGLGGE
jgi:Zn-finger nucleic acid-binding protein